MALTSIHTFMTLNPAMETAVSLTTSVICVNDDCPRVEEITFLHQRVLRNRHTLKPHIQPHKGFYRALYKRRVVTSRHKHQDSQKAHASCSHWPVNCQLVTGNNSLAAHLAATSNYITVSFECCGL